MTEYVLGTQQRELDRLVFQHEVWCGVTEGLLDRLGVGEGWSCLDVGCGPGLVALDLRERVGAHGRVVGLDVAEHWLRLLEQTAAERGYRNVETRCQRIETLERTDERFDLVLARWVIGFLPQAGEVIRSLAHLVAPGGVLAIQDYNHEGISVFPESRGLRAVVRAARELYRRTGGDPWIAGRLPALFRAAGLELIDYTPHVKCGGPASGVFRWAGQFFPAFVDDWVERGLLSEDERQLFLVEWQARLADPDATFFSPMVVDAAGRRPREARPGAP